jgi:deoxycytidylate deaminase
MYTTMEPCSVRLSGNRSCTSRLIEAGVACVVVGEGEPSNFVVCEGTKLLRQAGIKVGVNLQVPPCFTSAITSQVVYIDDVELVREVRTLNAHLTAAAR